MQTETQVLQKSIDPETKEAEAGLLELKVSFGDKIRFCLKQGSEQTKRVPRGLPEQAGG